MKNEKLIIVGILVSGAIALFASSASAKPAANSGLSWDPGLGKPRRQTQSKLAGVWEFPIDVYEWGDAAVPEARQILASSDPSSWVSFKPPSTGDLTQADILAQGTGSLTQAILNHLLTPVAA